jgi:uncharacterized protein YndB with AHSA1/START domain
MEPTVTREITVDAPAEEVWAAVTDDDARAEWLGEDGADRVVEVGHAVEGEQIAWTWRSPGEGPDAASRVTITLSPHPDGTTGVRVVEQLPPAAIARASAAPLEGEAAWHRRLLGLELWLLLALQRV